MKKIKQFWILFLLSLLVTGIHSVMAEASDDEEIQTIMPDWYPQNPEDFVPFHNTDAPRVVDEADIFTSEEEETMKHLIQNIQEKHQKDVVIYTTKTAYGLDKTTLTMDFYDFCGYGFGDEYEGICLCFVMDPDDRGFRVSATGSETRALYTGQEPSFMDNRLYEYVSTKEDENGKKVEGAYGEGVIDWIHNADTLFERGHAYFPSWYQDLEVNKEAIQDREVPRVTAENQAFTEEEIQKLSVRCKELSEQTGIDIIIHASNEVYWLSQEEYAEIYYRVMGYGFHDTYDGMMLYLRRGSSPLIYLNGERMERLNDVKLDRILARASFSNGRDSKYETASKWLDDLEYLLETGRVKRGKLYWVGMGLLAVVTGFISAWILSGIAAGEMKKPRIQETAVDYAVPGTLSVNLIKSTFIKTREEEHYEPVIKNSSSSSSSGSSSSGSSHYSSNSVGTSGRSHTTSGRDF